MELFYPIILAPLPARHLQARELPGRALLSISTAHGQYSRLGLLREPQEPCDHQLRVRGQGPAQDHSGPGQLGRSTFLPRFAAPGGAKQPPAPVTCSHSSAELALHSPRPLQPAPNPPRLSFPISTLPHHTSSAVPGDFVFLRQEGRKRKANPAEWLIKTLKPVPRGRQGQRCHLRRAVLATGGKGLEGSKRRGRGTQQQGLGAPAQSPPWPGHESQQRAAAPASRIFF